MIGLLYRADWTRLSLSAEVRSETDRNLLPAPVARSAVPLVPPPAGADARGGVVPLAPRLAGAAARRPLLVARGTLLIGPGGRWAPGHYRFPAGTPGKGPPRATTASAAGRGGRRLRTVPRHSRSRRRRRLCRGSRAALPVRPCSAATPWKSWARWQPPGRDAIAVAATPRRDVLGSGPGHWSHDRVEVAVDAELGILLRRIETSGGEFVILTELTDVTMNPPEAANPAGSRCRWAATAAKPRGNRPVVLTGPPSMGGWRPRRADQACAAPAAIAPARS